MKLIDKTFPWSHLILATITTILFLWALSARSATIQLAWDHNPPEDLVQSYILYEKFVTVPPPFWQELPVSTNYYKVGQVAGSTNGMVLTNVLVGPHTYVLTASNFWGESVFSNEAFTQVVPTEGAPPAPPGMLQIRVIDLETAEVNLQTFPVDTPGGQALVDHSYNAADWTPLLEVTSLSPANLISNFNFTVLADKPREFYRFRVLQP